MIYLLLLPKRTEGIHLFASFVLAQEDHLADGLATKVGGIVFVERRIDVDIGILAVFAILLEVGPVEEPANDAIGTGKAEEVVEQLHEFGRSVIVVVRMIHGEVDGNNLCRSQLSCDIDRQIVEDATVVEHVVIEAHSLEQCGNGHAGSHVTSQGVAREHDL